MVSSLLTKKDLVIHLEPGIFGSDRTLNVTSAKILKIDDGGKARNFVAVYVCVPILLVAVFVSVLVVLHYKK